jgi:hypothetical protein
LTNSYQLEFCEDSTVWDDFVDESAQGSLFSSTQFLDSWGQQAEKLLVTNNGRIVLGAVVLIDEKILVNPPVRYNGTLFPYDDPEIPNHRRTQKNLEAVEFLLKQLVRRWDIVRLSLHYNFDDLRAFQWYNFHRPELGQFKCSLRYTGILNLKNVGNINELQAGFRSGRRYDYRKSLNLGYTCKESKEVDLITRLQRLTYDRQGVSIDQEEQKLFEGLVESSIAKGFGDLLVCESPSGEPVAAALFMTDKECAYYVFGAMDPNFRKTGVGTLVLVEQLKRILESGKSKVDFCGINSPDRGDYKISFNAKPVPFFEVAWEAPN